MSLFPALPADTPFSEWDGLRLLVGAVLFEAEGEPDQGKLGVAWVAKNRSVEQRKSIADVLLEPWQFSCFNVDYRVQAVARLRAANASMLERCWWAACAAWWATVPDPTHGAVLYLNPELTRQIRPDRTLPSWYDQRRVKLRVGRHEFLIA